MLHLLHSNTTAQCTHYIDTNAKQLREIAVICAQYIVLKVRLRRIQSLVRYRLLGHRLLSDAGTLGGGVHARTYKTGVLGPHARAKTRSIK